MGSCCIRYGSGLVGLVGGIPGFVAFLWFVVVFRWWDGLDCRAVVVRDGRAWR